MYIYIYNNNNILKSIYCNIHNTDKQPQTNIHSHTYTHTLIHTHTYIYVC